MLPKACTSAVQQGEGWDASEKLCLEEMRLLVSSLRRAVAPLAIGNMGKVERRVHARTHGGPRSQVQCLAPYVDLAVVERTWEQKVPPCLLKGLEGLGMQSAACLVAHPRHGGGGGRQTGPGGS